MINLNKTSWKISETLRHYKYKPYKFRPVQNLTDQNKMERVAFCQEMIRRLQDDPNILRKILFTDEAAFTTAGMFNRKNKHFWATANPNKKQIVRIQGRRSIHIWCGMLDNRILGPVVIENNLNGERYLDLLRNEIEQILEELPLQVWNDIIWHQDGAPPHNSIEVVNYLSTKYDLWIGGRGPINWPANSPDLSPLDYFLWGYLKNKIYYNRPKTLPELANRIRAEINELNENNSDFIFNAITRRFLECLQKCLAAQGGWVD